jgi:hypothetical protein
MSQRKRLTLIAKSVGAKRMAMKKKSGRIKKMYAHICRRCPRVK